MSTTYRIEDRSMTAADAARAGKSGGNRRARRVWLRGYDAAGARVFQQLVGVYDSRSRRGEADVMLRAGLLLNKLQRGSNEPAL